MNKAFIDIPTRVKDILQEKGICLERLMLGLLSILLLVILWVGFRGELCFFDEAYYAMQLELQPQGRSTWWYKYVTLFRSVPLIVNRILNVGILCIAFGSLSFALSQRDNEKRFRSHSLAIQLFLFLLLGTFVFRPPYILVLSYIYLNVAIIAMAWGILLVGENASGKLIKMLCPSVVGMLMAQLWLVLPTNCIYVPFILLFYVKRRHWKSCFLFLTGLGAGLFFAIFLLIGKDVYLLGFSQAFERTLQAENGHSLTTLLNDSYHDFRNHHAWLLLTSLLFAYILSDKGKHHWVLFPTVFFLYLFVSMGVPWILHGILPNLSFLAFALALLLSGILNSDSRISSLWDAMLMLASVPCLCFGTDTGFLYRSGWYMGFPLAITWLELRRRSSILRLFFLLTLCGFAIAQIACFHHRNWTHSTFSRQTASLPIKQVKGICFLPENAQAVQQLSQHIPSKVLYVTGNTRYFWSVCYLFHLSPLSDIFHITNEQYLLENIRIKHIPPEQLLICNVSQEEANRYHGTQLSQEFWRVMKELYPDTEWSALPVDGYPGIAHFYVARQKNIP